MQGLFAAMGNGGPMSAAGRQAQERSRRFDEWLRYVTTDPSLSYEQRAAKLAAWRQAPEGTYAHPREEHLIPVRGPGCSTRGEWLRCRRGPAQCRVGLPGAARRAARRAHPPLPAAAHPHPTLPRCSCTWCLGRARAMWPSSYLTT